MQIFVHKEAHIGLLRCLEAKESMCLIKVMRTTQAYIHKTSQLLQVMMIHTPIIT